MKISESILEEEIRKMRNICRIHMKKRTPFFLIPVGLKMKEKAIKILMTGGKSNASTTIHKMDIIGMKLVQSAKLVPSLQ